MNWSICVTGRRSLDFFTYIKNISVHCNLLPAEQQYKYPGAFGSYYFHIPT